MVAVADLLAPPPTPTRVEDVPIHWPSAKGPIQLEPRPSQYPSLATTAAGNGASSSPHSSPRRARAATPTDYAALQAAEQQRRRPATACTASRGGRPNHHQLLQRPLTAARARPASSHGVVNVVVTRGRARGMSVPMDVVMPGPPAPPPPRPLSPPRPLQPYHQPQPQPPQPQPQTPPPPQQQPPPPQVDPGAVYDEWLGCTRGEGNAFISPRTSRMLLDAVRTRPLKPPVTVPVTVPVAVPVAGPLGPAGTCTQAEAAERWAELSTRCAVLHANLEGACRRIEALADEKRSLQRLQVEAVHTIRQLEYRCSDRNVGGLEAQLAEIQAQLNAARSAIKEGHAARVALEARVAQLEGGGEGGGGHRGGGSGGGTGKGRAS